MDLIRERKHSGQLEGFFRRLDALEIPLIRKLTCGCESLKLQRTGLFVNRLANGWLYLGVGVALAVLEGRQSWLPLAAALVSVGLAFLMYLPLKASLARTRPYDLDPELPCPCRALDRFSCPSGHCMTAVAVGIPLGWTHSALLPVIVGAIFLVAWARLALGHHYVTDLVAGVALGCVASIPVSALLLA
jgi:undecaprenyl-diphosphatase